MGKHGNLFGFFQLLGLDKLPKPVRQRLPAQDVVAGIIRFEVAHHNWAMAERHDLPRQPADDRIHAVKTRLHHDLGQPFNPADSAAMNGRQAVKRRSGCPAGLVSWWAIDEGGKSGSLPWRRDVSDVEEGAGPILHGFYVWDLWIPVWLPAVEGDAAAGCQLAACYGLPATKEAVPEQLYGGSNAQVPLTECLEAGKHQDAVGRDVVRLEAVEAQDRQEEGGER